METIYVKILYMQGIYAIYKPKEPTSNQIISQIRKITGEKRVGHAGTLDPLAQGILIIGIGREYTKQLRDLTNKEKEYIARIKFGATSMTDDAEGEIIKTEVKKKPTKKDIEEAICEFIGNIKQEPPQFSAVKRQGREAYKYARKGEHINLGFRDIEIKSIEIIKYKWPVLKIKVVTGPGAYIRSLARDIGKELEVGGYLAGLERTRVGEFDKGKALTIKDFEKIC